MSIHYLKGQRALIGVFMIVYWLNKGDKKSNVCSILCMFHIWQTLILGLTSGEAP